jgi:hypothetical protein
MPEPTYTLNQIAAAIGIPAARVTQWIAEGSFRAPRSALSPDASGWQIQDAIRLAVCASLVDAGLTPQAAGRVAASLPEVRADDAYLIVARPRAGDQAVAQVVRSSRLTETLGQSRRNTAIVLNLGSVGQVMRRKLSPGSSNPANP